MKWIKQFFKKPTSVWNFIPSYVFNNLGGLNCLFQCNYEVSKIPTRLSSFHKQMLSCWTLFYKHNFTPHNYFIWNNGDIK